MIDRSTFIQLLLEEHAKFAYEKWRILTGNVISPRNWEDVLPETKELWINLVEAQALNLLRKPLPAPKTSRGPIPKELWTKMVAAKAAPKKAEDDVPIAATPGYFNETVSTLRRQIKACFELSGASQETIHFYYGLLSAIVQEHTFSEDINSRLTQAFNSERDLDRRLNKLERERTNNA